MNVICLKSIRRDPMTFARLVEPTSKDIVNDQTLYAAVRKHGYAVIYKECGKPGSLAFDKDPTTLMPDEFQETWMGD